jgi:hypothetical protein
MKLTNKQLDKIKDITFRHDLHYELWDWLAKHPDKDVLAYFKFHIPRKIPYQTSYACDYAIKVQGILNPSFRKHPCLFCPFNASLDKFCLNGIYPLYASATRDDKHKYAMLIRDMELNPMYNFKDSV